MNLCNRPIHQKPERFPADPAYLARVRELPCCVCQAFGEYQISPTQAHHPIHGRYGTRRAHDYTAIPLCHGHHQGDMDTSKVALHREPSKWKRLYGEDHEYIEVTQDKLGWKP